MGRSPGVAIEACGCSSGLWKSKLLVVGELSVTFTAAVVVDAAEVVAYIFRAAAMPSPTCCLVLVSGTSTAAAAVTGGALAAVAVDTAVEGAETITAAAVAADIAGRISTPVLASESARSLPVWSMPLLSTPLESAASSNIGWASGI